MNNGQRPASGPVAALVSILTFAILLTGTLTAPGHARDHIAVTGTIRESGTDQPVGYATIQVDGTGRVTTSNAEGRYRIMIDRSDTRLKFSHIAYHTRFERVEPTDTLVTLDVRLELSALQGDTLVVTTRALEPGLRIIREAIRRKQDILGRISSYKFDAYVKLVVENTADPDAAEIWLLSETQLTSMWEKPDTYKDVIHYRRQSANLEAEDNMVYVGKVVNFNENRIVFGRHSIVSPTATDALDHYDFYLIDTVQIDARPAFLLEMEPKNPDLPRFVGRIHIADSTYDVLDVDVGFSRGVEISMVSNLRYGQRFAKFEDEFWLPVEERVTYDIEFGVKIPTVPRQLRLTYLAAMQDYEIDQGHPKGTMDGIVLEVDESADDFDSLTWYAGPFVPLTEHEESSLERIDSLENLPRSVSQYVGLGALGVAAAAAGRVSDFYRFNRVESVYLGGVVPFEVGRRLDVKLALGYSFGTKRVWQKYGLEYRAVDSWRLDLGLEYKLQAQKRPTFSTSRSYDPSGLALLAQLDPFNYYQTQAFRAWTAFTPFRSGRLYLDYRDEAHSSLALSTDYSLFNRSRPVRDNPAIDDGRLRSFGVRLSLDSRPFMMNKGREQILGRTQYTRFDVSAEVSDPGFIESDFDYTRISARLFRRQRTLGAGVTSLELRAGGSDGNMPSQRFFGADDGNGVFFKRGGYYTFDQQTYGGGRYAAVWLYHNFRQLLFVQSGIPGIKKLPFWLTVYGSVLWADFQNLAWLAGEPLLLSADRPYSELGFGLANLTPFANPLNFAIYFTWQLSNYDTRDFSLRIGLEL